MISIPHSKHWPLDGFDFEAVFNLRPFSKLNLFHKFNITVNSMKGFDKEVECIVRRVNVRGKVEEKYT